MSIFYVSAFKIGREIAAKVRISDEWSFLEISRYYLPRAFLEVKSFRDPKHSRELRRLEILERRVDLDEISKRYILQGFLAEVIDGYLREKQERSSTVIQSHFLNIVKQNKSPGGFLYNEFVTPAEIQEKDLIEDIISYVKNPPTDGNSEDNEIQYLLLFQLLNVIRILPQREHTGSKQLIPEGLQGHLLFLSDILITLYESTMWVGVADMLTKICTSPGLEISHGEILKLRSYGTTYERIMDDESFKDDMFTEMSMALSSYQRLKKNKELGKWVKSLPFLSPTLIGALGKGKEWSKSIRHYERYQDSIIKIKNTYENRNYAKMMKNGEE